MCDPRITTMSQGVYPSVLVEIRHFVLLSAIGFEEKSLHGIASIRQETQLCEVRSLVELQASAAIEA